ncbi:hypothetical protein B0H16DRAFT_1799816 [Mycena metata]|uniref:Uncharacterized protein n=1 Tax=Mycena metata TaxID=1033252 RepID=A0AAD7NK08_9AGAR|nr:hypothetical protein B0H16DRAFT_1799816 [Mycena metata]
MPATTDDDNRDSDGGGDGSFSYAENDLSKCDVTEYEITARPGDRLITASAAIQCKAPIAFQAVTSCSFSNHEKVGTIAAGTFPENSLARAITDAMDNFGNETYGDIYSGLYITNDEDITVLSQKVYKVVASGHPECSEQPPFACTIPSFDFYNAIGNTDLGIINGGAEDIAADEDNLYNVIKVFFAAVRLDLGHWTPDNIFTNTTAFNTTISPTDDTVHAGSAAFRSFASSKGMAYINLTTPPAPDDPTPRAVIQVAYTCNIKQRKSPGSFFVSVLSATLSMFLGVWGAALALLSSIAKRASGGNRAEETSW